MGIQTFKGFKLVLVVPFATALALGSCSSAESKLKRPQIADKTSPANGEGKTNDNKQLGSSANDATAGDGFSKNKSPADPSPQVKVPTAGSEPASGTATDAASNPASVDSTKGSGGPTGDLELKSASGLNFLMNAPADVHTSGKAYGVLVLLHGSTASNYRNFVKQMADVAQKRDLIRVSVLAPNGQGWNEGGEVAAADALHALVQQEIMAKYNIDRKKVLFSGQSSGGGFLSTNFVPQHAKDYQGGAFMLCGAAAPRVAFTPDEATKSNFRLHFEITTGDPIWPASYKTALVKYTAAGMNFSKDDTKPGGHCAFNQQQVILDHIDFILGKNP